VSSNASGCLPASEVRDHLGEREAGLGYLEGSRSNRRGNEVSLPGAPRSIASSDGSARNNLARRPPELAEAPRLFPRSAIVANRCERRIEVTQSESFTQA
jgi:hypothetical protein